ncbi:hypothetical protein EUTSA_v10006393mg [Eutrema salsugineum]|uniref:FLZ-type domain-containing protein n=1 Tax=Eutrema salsugineum TaxID=72664 RepID=V4LJ43_EUTSA|nr:hypothetical protein EUTSA_v10006393mg [Eutrema salsugineum]
MTDLMVPSKRPRAPSFVNKHHDYSATVPSDWSSEKTIRQVPINKFLEICRFCKKNLSHDDDIFMYGAKQIACDIICTESSREIAKAKKGRMVEAGKIKAKEPKEEEEESEAVGYRERNPSPRLHASSISADVIASATSVITSLADADDVVFSLPICSSTCNLTRATEPLFDYKCSK